MSEQPNVLIMHTHDTGRHLGTYGRGPSTPNLDRLGEEGVVFELAFCSAPQCSPSRGSLFTGMMPHTNGLIGLAHRGFRYHDDTYGKHLAAVLRKEGYATHLFGFQHEAADPSLLGYEHVAELKNTRVAEVVPAVERFFDDGVQEPFLAVVGVSETHRAFTEGKTCRGEVVLPPHLPDHQDVRLDVNNLCVDVEAVDEGYGRVLEALNRAGLDERTLVIYTTDHGIAFPGAKSTLFDPGIEVSLIVKGPGGFEGGKRISGLVSNVDVFPTIMDTLGLQGHDTAEGRSLVPLVAGATDDEREEVFVEQTYHAGYDPMRGIRTRRYKYTRNFEPRSYYFAPNVDPGYSKTVVRGETDYFSRSRPEEFLFDLESDPHEQNNLAKDPAHAETLNELCSRLTRWMEETDDPLLEGFVPPPSGSVISRDDGIEPREALPAEEWLAARKAD